MRVAIAVEAAAATLIQCQLRGRYFRWCWRAIGEVARWLQRFSLGCVQLRRLRAEVGRTDVLLAAAVGTKLAKGGGVEKREKRAERKRVTVAAAREAHGVAAEALGTALQLRHGVAWAKAAAAGAALAARTAAAQVEIVHMLVPAFLLRLHREELRLRAG